MREITKEEPATSAGIDLSGVPTELHALLRSIEAVDPKSAAVDAAACKRVSVTKDGFVIVQLLQPVKVGKDEEEHERLRLRPLKARDYFDGTADDADDPSFNATLRFASKLAKPAGIVDELPTLDDMKSVYFGVQALRGNFSRPRT